jgi:hypothetical protein
MSNMLKRASQFVTFCSMAALAVGCSTQDPSAETEAFQGRSARNKTSLTLFSVVPSAKEPTSRCYYMSESAQPLSAKAASVHKFLNRLNENAVSDSQVKQALRTLANENSKTLVISSAGTVGSCSAAIAKATATIGTLLGPGTQFLTPGAAALTVAGLIGCGVSATTATNAIWSAWLFNDLKDSLPKTDAGVRLEDKPEAALRSLVSALEIAKFHGDEELTCSQKPSL